MTMVTLTNTSEALRYSPLGDKDLPVSHHGYTEDVDSIRQREYSVVTDTTYLDHAGTTLYAKSMIEAFTAELTTTLFGNPHSVSTSSQTSSRRIEDARLAALRFFNADPQEFDLVFVANATAAIKLVADACRDNEGDFWYGFHSDCHTSLVGVRELAQLGSTCFRDDAAVQNWINSLSACDFARKHVTLFAYPGQSNMTGRRLPYDWCSQLRSAAVRTGRRIYSLFDAAALASTSPLDFSNAGAAPDFTALSFYKIFGFPDLGALIVRKQSADILRRRRYFGGGTVDVVSACGGLPWHVKKESIHSSLEDGTLAFHSIIALDHAIKAHLRLYGSMRNVANHTAALRTALYSKMDALTHSNGRPICKIHGQKPSSLAPYGPVIAFNLLDESGRFVSNSDVEKLGIVKNIQFRTGGLCNPGGVAKHFNLTAEDLKRNYAAGVRCGSGNDTVTGMPTGAIRVSFGAMSSRGDVDKFVDFLDEFYVSREIPERPCLLSKPLRAPRFSIDSMSIFPIKSCSAFKVPADTDWEVSAKGLSWDREWCLLHQGTNAALSQKQYPQMALIRPKIDPVRRVMNVSYDGSALERSIQIDLNDAPAAMVSTRICGQFKPSQSTVCGDNVPVHVYTLPSISDFFTEALGVPCALARYFDAESSMRKARLRRPRPKGPTVVETSSSSGLSIKLANESPILLVSRSSVNRLNENIRQRRSQPQEILPESFRANIVISEEPSQPEAESPYVEDMWQHLTIGSGSTATSFDVLGPCQRCQMVGVDQNSARRRTEPFSTLAKTRRWDGGVWFGVHLCLSATATATTTTTTTITNSGAPPAPRKVMTLRTGAHVLAS